ncbi:hypothetical protein [Macrococcus armenti]|uniref:hypothetical protein n=1 Tax=Macrococcus armenti TaxID=2875764 RepID=UPI001CCF0C45|nr:hypothetical protein [Macrococcus armenti]UBH14521.1 hypothetical protein LAU44_06975 [Macrococcus armenti]UBH16882.1 hypothetical protein LAU39_07000 [Macrococcus armenti]UBH19144.1 hypothetical protein LAU40_06980 [Macrococcus armenti]
MHEVCYAGGSGSYPGIKAKQEKINQALNDAKTAQQAFDEARNMTTELVQFIESSEWKGEYKESVYKMLIIMEEFQKDLKTALDDHVQAIEALRSSLGEYDQLAITQGLKGVEV